MQIKFRTESGSIYLLDDATMTWERLEHHPDSNLVRTKSGDLREMPVVEVGKTVTILGTALDPEIRKIPGSVRVLATTKVTEILLDTPQNITRMNPEEEKTNWQTMIVN